MKCCHQHTTRRTGGGRVVRYDFLDFEEADAAAATAKAEACVAAVRRSCVLIDLLLSTVQEGVVLDANYRLPPDVPGGLGLSSLQARVMSCACVEHEHLLGWVRCPALITLVVLRAALSFCVVRFVPTLLYPAAVLFSSFFS